MWRHNAGPVMQFVGYDDSYDSRFLSLGIQTTYTNLFDKSSTTVTANTPGYKINLQYHNSVNQSGVPVCLAIYATGTGAGAAFRATDGTNSLEITGITSLDWYRVTGTMPATENQKWDFQGKTAAGEDSLHVYSACIYEID